MRGVSGLVKSHKGTGGCKECFMLIVGDKLCEARLRMNDVKSVS